MMGLARSSYYYAPVSEETSSQEEVALVQKVKQIQEKFPLYGYRRLVALLKRNGMCINHKRMKRILKTHNLSPKPYRKCRVKTTNSAHGYAVFPNLLRGKTIDFINQVWVADITYLRVGARFAYLSMLLDVYSRKLLSWAVSYSLEARLCETALEEALAVRVPQTGCIHHSDHGVQYASGLYVQRLKGVGFQLSMAGKGKSWENGYAESFFKTLKYEEVLRNEYQTMREAIESISSFIDQVYNKERLHSGLGYRSPDEFEACLKDEAFYTNRPVLTLP